MSFASEIYQPSFASSGLCLSLEWGSDKAGALYLIQFEKQGLSRAVVVISVDFGGWDFWRHAAFQTAVLRIRESPLLQRSSEHELQRAS